MKVRSASALIFSIAFSCAAFAQTGEQLAKAKGCTACHSVDGVGVGPSFHDIAQR
ncbi:c-type cytochrome, partial [Paraburkholderia dinghuensis]